MLDMLTKREWPVWLSASEQYTINGIAEERPIVYYFGYFLVPALFGKAFGWLGSNIAFWCWTALHLFASLALALIWVADKKEKLSRLSLAILTFIFTSGLGFVGWWVKYGLAGYKTSYLWHESVVWNLPFVFTPHWHLILWTPHHGLGAWIATILILFAFKYRWLLSYIGLALGSLLIVSPFGTVGILPFLSILFLYSLINKTWTKLFSVFNLVGGVTIFLCSAAFITSNSFNFPILNMLTANEGEWRPLYVWFLAFEVGFAAILFLLFLKKLTFFNIVLILISFITLCLIPILKMGEWNDFCARASIPAWLIVGLMLSDITLIWLQRISFSRIVIASCFIFLMGLTSFTGDLYSSFANYRIALPKPKQFIEYDKGTVTQQRLGNKNTIFFNYLARNNQE